MAYKRADNLCCLTTNYRFSMARIYDNIESRFAQGLQDLITDVGIKRVDFCVGYFNLRGWDLVVN